MGMNDEEVDDLYGGFAGGCDIHGDQYMSECGMCGVEFCTKCNRGSSVCPDCAEMVDEDDDRADPDFEDVANLDDLGFEDDEADRLTESEDDPTF